MPPESQDPVPLTRPGGLRESWFDGHPPRSSLTSIPPSAPFAKVSAGRALVAGAIAGIFGGVAFACVPQIVADGTRHPVAVTRVFGSILTRDVTSQPYAGVVGCALVGLVLGALITLVTKHVKRALPIALFGLLFAPIVWLAVQSLVLPRTAPWLAAALPIGPMLLGAAAGGLTLVLAIPIRGGS
jgi:hypothetical protein